MAVLRRSVVADVTAKGVKWAQTLDGVVRSSRYRGPLSAVFSRSAPRFVIDLLLARQPVNIFGLKVLKKDLLGVNGNKLARKQVENLPIVG